MKTICLLSRKAGSTPAQFRDYYETRHAVLGMTHFPFRKYLRNHLIEAAEPVNFDCYSEFWHDDAGKAFETMAGPIGEIMRADEARFMDRSLIRAAYSEEKLVAGPARDIDPPGTRKQVLFLKRAGGADRPALLDQAARWGEDIFRAAGGSVTRVSLDAITPIGDQPYPYDAVMSLWLAPGNGLLTLPQPPAGVAVAATTLLEACETTPDVLAATYTGQAA